MTKRLTRSPEFSPTTDKNKVIKYRKTAVNLPPLEPGVGMMCTRSGYVRYLNEIQTFFASQRYFGRRIHALVYRYVGDANFGNVATTPRQLIKQTPKFMMSGKNIPQVVSQPTDVYYVMVFVQNKWADTMGHAISVLVDPTTPRMWVFDPHGGASSEYGAVTRDRVVPNIKKMFGLSESPVRAAYYTGPNLQIGNTRGICTTFYVSFAERVMDLLKRTITINDLGRLQPNSDTLAKRLQFLNRPGATDRNVVYREPTALDVRKFHMTMGKKSALMMSRE